MSHFIWALAVCFALWGGFFVGQNNRDDYWQRSSSFWEHQTHQWQQLTDRAIVAAERCVNLKQN